MYKEIYINWESKTCCCCCTSLDGVSGGNGLYWCTEKFTGTTIMIGKGCEEYDKIHDFVATNNYDECQEYLLNIVLKHITTTEFKDYIKHIKENFYEQGMIAKQNEFRKTLGL